MDLGLEEAFERGQRQCLYGQMWNGSLGMRVSDEESAKMGAIIPGERKCEQK